jgi:hypothetical protein
MMFKSDGRFVCWVCAETSGFKGRPEFALQELLGMSLSSIKEKIYGDSADGQTPSTSSSASGTSTGTSRIRRPTWSRLRSRA